jgi:hypothetical protein
MAIAEPPKQNSLGLLTPRMRPGAESVLEHMKDLGYDPVVNETLRIRKRQAWLYGAGRTALQCIAAGISPVWARPGARRVTKTMRSRHLPDKLGLSCALDIRSKKRGYEWPEFFAELTKQYKRVGFVTLESMGDLAHGELPK